MKIWTDRNTIMKMIRERHPLVNLTLGKSGSREKICELFLDNNNDALTPKQISDRLLKNYNTVKNIILNLASQNVLVSEDGYYRLRDYEKVIF